MLDKTICVIGLGYIGLPTASLLGIKGFQVHGVDVSEHAFSSSIKERNKTCIHDPFIRKINYSDTNASKLSNNVRHSGSILAGIHRSAGTMPVISGFTRHGFPLKAAGMTAKALTYWH
jgi:nucleoside-diphosphate-sugar epimerase